MAHKTQKKRWYEAIVAYEGTAPTVAIYWDYSTGAASLSAGTSETNIIRTILKTATNYRLIQIKITAGGADTEVDTIGLTFRRFETLVEVV